MDTKVLIQERASLYQAIREYFRAQQVMEVDVPVLGRTTATDTHLASFSVSAENQEYYLQTSPEFFMKRLLAQGSGSIFSLGKAFRASESGARHNPEFAMLEWYRVGFSLEQLMDDVTSLVSKLLPEFKPSRVEHASLFERYLDTCPHSAETSELQKLANRYSGLQLDRSESLDVLMSVVIEPRLAQTECFVTNYPCCQVAMAQVKEDSQGRNIARRFELYIEGVEIANGYEELRDRDEQLGRMAQHNEERVEKGLPQVPIDQKFLRAITRMPECSGVALGLDRLLWLLCKRKKILADSSGISHILHFPWNEL